MQRGIHFLLLIGAALAVVVRLAMAWDALASQPQMPVVKIQPPSQVVHPADGNVNVEVAVENTGELGDFEFTLLFDPGIISLLDVQVGPFLGSTGRTVVCQPPIITEQTVRFGCNTVGLTPPGPSGSGVLAVLTFSPHVAGTRPLDLIDCELSALLGDQIPTTCESGEVTVLFSQFCPITVPGLPDIRIDPVSQEVLLGRDFTVNAEVVDTGELGDFEFTLLFDPAIISLLDVQVGPFVGSTGRTVVCQPPIITEQTVRFGCNTVGLTPPGPSGSGVLAVLTFFANAVGVSPLALTACELSTILGNPVPANCKCGLVEVPLVRMEKDADPLRPGVQLTNNLWLMEDGCQTEQQKLEGKGCLIVEERVFNVADPDGLGAYEFQIKFDHKVLDIVVEDAGFLGSLGRTVDCTMTIIGENDIRFGCVSSGTGAGPTGSGVLARLYVSPEGDMKYRLTPGQENGVVRTILDENCELADVLGDPLADGDGEPLLGILPGGLVEECSDATITVRILEGDLNLDCEVNIIDGQMIAYRYGAFMHNALYDPWYDLEPALKDSDIDIKDLQKAFGRNGSTCSNPIPPQPPLGPP